jgi:hypothetical protein
MCLTQWISDEETLRKHLTAKVNERNAKGSRVGWKFTIQDARRKLNRLYLHVSV